MNYILAQTIAVLLDASTFALPDTETDYREALLAQKGAITRAFTFSPSKGSSLAALYSFVNLVQRLNWHMSSLSIPSFLSSVITPSTSRESRREPDSGHSTLGKRFGEWHRRPSPVFCL